MSKKEIQQKIDKEVEGCEAEDYPNTISLVEGNEYKELLKVILEAKSFTKVTIVDEWKDDHLPCFAFEARTDTGYNVKFSWWWAEARKAYVVEDNPKKHGASFMDMIQREMKGYVEDIVLRDDEEEESEEEYNYRVKGKRSNEEDSEERGGSYHRELE